MCLIGLLFQSWESRLPLVIGHRTFFREEKKKMATVLHFLLKWDWFPQSLATMAIVTPFTWFFFFSSFKSLRGNFWNKISAVLSLQTVIYEGLGGVFCHWCQHADKEWHAYVHDYKLTSSLWPQGPTNKRHNIAITFFICLVWFLLTFIQKSCEIALAEP